MVEEVSEVKHKKKRKKKLMSEETEDVSMELEVIPAEEIPDEELVETVEKRKKKHKPGETEDVSMVLEVKPAEEIPDEELVEAVSDEAIAGDIELAKPEIAEGEFRFTDLTLY